ncbi:hypothetical protein HDU97_001337 [Phlyctochytrium planicorne]|nr:hypothetical protein HDU97_001337 [Phlyctochytrium planicorne]
MAGATGIKKQARFRLPLFVSIMSVVFTMTALVAVVVGYLTLSKSLDSINDITTQVRTAILNRTREAVESTLDGTMRTLKVKAKNTLLSQFVSQWSPNSTWLSNPLVLAYHYQFAADMPALENTGVVFKSEGGNSQQSAYLAVYPSWGQVYSQDASTKYVLTGSPIISQNEDYTLNLSTNTSVIRTDWMPEVKFPELAAGGIVKGSPFWSNPIYTPVVKTFLIPLFWPVWAGKAIGSVGEGDFRAAHFAMLSIKSLDDFLKTVQVTPNGVISLIEGKTGLMLASSLDGIAQNGTANSRFSAISNPNALVSASASFVANQYGSGTIESIPANSAVDFATSFKGLGDDILVNGHWITDSSTGIRWLLLLSIPSNDFLSVIRTTFRNTIIFIVTFSVASLLLSGLLSYFITSPLSKLAKSMVAATQFDFSDLRDGYLERRSCVSEIGKLEGVFHEMMLKFSQAIRANKSLVAGQYTGLSSSHGKSSTAIQIDSRNSAVPAPPLKSPAAPWE